MSELAGTVAVVTGAAGGLGGAIVDALVAAGSTPVLLDANAEAVSAAADQRGALGIACDVTTPCNARWPSTAAATSS